MLAIIAAREFIAAYAIAAYAIIAARKIIAASALYVLYLMQLL